MSLASVTARLRDRRAVPVVGAPLLGLLGLVEAASDPGFRPHLAALAVTAAWVTLAFASMLRWPAAGAVLVGCFYPLSALLGAPGPGGTGLIATLVGCAYAGHAAPAYRSRWAAAGCIGVFVLTDAARHGLTWDSVFFPLVFLPAWWTGTLVQREQRRSREVLELAAQLDAQRETAAHAAVVEERARIAREVHDSVAHSVSVMTLQIGGLRRQLDGVLADRPAEREVMLGLERLGRQSVEELRAAVGILREPEEAAPGATPTLARADELVADVRAAGLSVDLESTGDLATLPRALDVAAYRVAQEALTNVLRHAPGAHAVLRLERTERQVTVTVTDDGAAVAPPQHVNGVGGHGLVGMRERTAMYGGTLAAGPRPERGFEVRATFPVGREWQ